MKNWHEELPDMVAKVEHLTKGAAIVEKRRLAEEAEAKRKAEEEKEKEFA